MNTRVTLTLPEELYEHANAGQPLPDETFPRCSPMPWPLR